jgi:hypothetical protein
MSFLEVNVESIFVVRVCLGLAGLTYAGQWGCALSEGTPHARYQVVYGTRFAWGSQA